MNISDIRRDDSGKLPAYAWPGGYPIIYVAEDGGVICPNCANGENGSEAMVADEGTGAADWNMVAADIYYEGPPLHCDHCNAEVESAYGGPEVKSYYVLLTAGEGYLVGGSKTHESSRFTTRQDAQNWAESGVQINQTACRDIKSVEVLSSQLDPEIGELV